MLRFVSVVCALLSLLFGSVRFGSSPELAFARLWSPSGVAFRAGCFSAALPAVRAAAVPGGVVVLDLDETVFCSGAEQVRAAAEGEGFSVAAYSAAVAGRSRLAPVPGAVSFVAACRAAGLRCVFVSGRPAGDVPASVAALRAVGVPVAAADVFCVGSGRRKAACFAALGAPVVASVGDAAADFVPGSVRVVLPNAFYGPDLTGFSGRRAF